MRGRYDIIVKDNIAFDHKNMVNENITVNNGTDSAKKLQILEAQKITGYMTESASDTKGVYKQLSYLSDISKSQSWALYTHTVQGKDMTTSYWQGKKISAREDKKIADRMREVEKPVDSDAQK